MRRLFVIGSGIKSLAHLSKESVVLIENADRLLYLVNDRIFSNFLKKKQKNSESLEKIYFQYKFRQDAYYALTEKVITEYYQNKNLCLLVYGHPTFFVDFAIDAAKKIKEQGGNVVILPAISSLDCLFADLLINPSQDGVCIHDATQLLAHNKNIDIHSYLILYQGSSLGMLDMKLSVFIGLLKHYLINFYPEDHKISIYSASRIPGKRYSLETISLNKIDISHISPISTICIPPMKPRKVNPLITNIICNLYS